jgi:nucleoside-diphosphate-sugar epimerase
MRALVTGSTGLLGNNLVLTLLAAGHEVWALTKSTEKAQRGLDFRWVTFTWTKSRLCVKVEPVTHPGSMPSLSFTAILKRCWQPM